MFIDILCAVGTACLWAVWIMIPAYIPNPAAALVGGGTPIDFGKCAKDGNRIFGEGKTWRGLIGGILIGIVFGAIQIALQTFLPDTFIGTLPQHTPVTVCALAVGSLLGDLTKSYFKRRLGKDRGSKWPIADMYDMVVGSLVLMILALLATGGLSWFVDTFETVGFGIGVFVAILVVSPLLHRGTNIIGYLLGLKKVPW